MHILTASKTGVGFGQLLFLLWYLNGHRIKTCRFCLKPLWRVYFKTSKPGVGYGQLFSLVWDLTGHKLKTCIFCLFSHTNFVQLITKEAMDIKSNKNSPKQLTPVTIMVIDTISSVKLRIILKVLLDSGSTTTMINRKCLPRNCQTFKISKSRKIGTLAGSYTSSEMVVFAISGYLSLTRTAMWINKRH